MRTFLVFIAWAVLAGAVRAQSVLQLYGKTGYLGEYELSGTLSEQSANAGSQYAGPLLIKHIGLCSHTGPQETITQIKLQIERPSQRVMAALVFDGVECTYRGSSPSPITASWIAQITRAFRSDYGPNDKRVHAHGGVGDDMRGRRWRNPPGLLLACFFTGRPIGAGLSDESALPPRPQPASWFSTRGAYAAVDPTDWDSSCRSPA